MCEAKPGVRCAADTREDALQTWEQYTAAHPAGPDVGPLCERGKSALLATARAAVPRDRSAEHRRYYEQTDAKHFGDPSVAGSKFTNPYLRRVEDVVALTCWQRGSLAGDDRDTFIAAGCDPQAFQDGVRYLLVRTPGTVGIVHSQALPADTPARIVRDKVGVPCAVAVDVPEQVTTTYGCLIVTADKDTGEDIVLTTFPGPVTRPMDSDVLDAHEGQTLTVGQVRDLLGRDFHAVTRTC